MGVGGNVFELRVFGRLLNQECLNVYHYRQTSATAVENSSEDLIDAYREIVRDALLAVQSTQYTVERYEAFNVSVVGPDFYALSELTPVAGLRTGEVMSSFQSWGFRYNRATRLSRNGWKRLAGVSEGDSQNGVAIPGIISALGLAAAAMAQNISGTLYNVSFEPVIYRAIETGTGQPPGAFPINGVNYIRITTQNTRKIGRGS